MRQCAEIEYWVSVTMRKISNVFDSACGFSHCGSYGAILCLHDDYTS